MWLEAAVLNYSHLWHQWPSFPPQEQSWEKSHLTFFARKSKPFLDLPAKRVVQRSRSLPTSRNDLERKPSLVENAPLAAHPNNDLQPPQTNYNVRVLRKANLEWSLCLSQGLSNRCIALLHRFDSSRKWLQYCSQTKNAQCYSLQKRLLVVFRHWPVMIRSLRVDLRQSLVQPANLSVLHDPSARQALDPRSDNQ